jgi:hypothetical protein
MGLTTGNRAAKIMGIIFRAIIKPSIGLCYQAEIDGIVDY